MTHKFRSNFTFGGPIAESDHLLSTGYFDNGDYEAIESREDKRCFVIGRTGSGKSAAFQRLEEMQPHKIIRIDPESLSLPYILNLNIIRELLKINVHLEPFLKTLWKHVIVVEILRHRYKITTPEQKRNLLHFLRQRFERDAAKNKALEYLDKFGDKFWCETDERIKQVADTFVQKLGAEANVNTMISAIGLKGSGSLESTLTQETKQEIANRYQKIVNEMQLPYLNQMLSILNSEILDSPQHFTYLIIDDLDKEWIDEDLAILLIKCLFQAVVDMQKVQHLKILVALRTNIFNQLNYGAQARGGQEEKFRGLSLELQWTQNDLASLLEVRAQAASAYYKIDPPLSIAEMLPHTKSKRFEKIDYILERTLMRPRDAIMFLNRCVREATGKERITWENIRDAEKKYSQDRLLALRDEWKDPYIGIERVFEEFRETNAKLSRDEITLILQNIGLLLADQNFAGGSWLNEFAQYIWEENHDWNLTYRPLINLLYRISFIGIVAGKDQKARYSYEDHGLQYILGSFQENTYFEIHPAFRAALNVKERIIT